MSKDYVLYHAGCMDGFGAAYAAWTILGGQAEYIPVSYGYPPPDLEDARDVYLLDFSYKEEELEELRKQVSGEFVVIDHHKTNAHLDKLEYAIYKQENSGAVLAWEYFRPDEDIPWMLRYIEDRDIWKWEVDYSEEINATLQSYPKDFKTWSALLRDIEEYDYYGRHYEGLVNEGRAILRARNQLVGEVVRNAQVTSFYGYDGVPVVGTPVLHSEVGHVLLQLYSEAPFSVTYRDTVKDGRTVRSFSLRSEDDREDVSRIARENGGGGHRNAAGFEVEVSTRAKYGV